MTDGMEWIPAGSFLMGSDSHYPEESPAHEVELDGFWIDRTAVTNREFGRFVEATGYVTVAERAPRPEDYPGVPVERLVAGSAVFVQPPGPVDLNAPPSWWHYMPGASWRLPDGRGGASAGRLDHPVVQVALDDARAYAAWAGKSLPSEAQWERAARGGLIGASFCWGEERTVDGVPPANVWVGEFPWQNLRERAPGTEPVAAHPANGFGLHEMGGNVWEWTTDLYGDGHRTGPHCCASRNPTGPSAAQADVAAPGIPMHTLKGGSFLCAPNYCDRARPAARIPQAADSGSVHIGFRCVVAGPGPETVSNPTQHEEMISR